MLNFNLILILFVITAAVLTVAGVVALILFLVLKNKKKPAQIKSEEQEVK